MKKCIVVAVALVFALGLANTVFAAANAFVDVPANHWAYKALSQLARDGIINPLNSSKYNGDMTITRYEMAGMVANAMARVENANAEDLALINKLSSEFDQELKTLGFNMTSLERKNDRVKMMALLLMTNDYHGVRNSFVVDKFKEYGTHFESGHKICLDAFYKVNDEWTALTQLEYVRAWRSVAEGQHETPGLNMSMHGKVGGTLMTYGRFHYDFAEGLVIGDFITGGQVSFGGSAGGPPIGPPGPGANKPRLTLTMATLDQYAGAHPLTPLLAVKYPRYGSVEVVYPLSKSTNFKTTFNRVYTYDNSVKAQNYVEGGFDTAFGNGMKLTAAYAKSTYDTDHFAWVIGVHSKYADFMKAGEQEGWFNYVRNDANGSIRSYFDVNDGYHGAKGYEIGYAYVPAKKIKIDVRYIQMRATKADDHWLDKWIRLECLYYM
ncbi:MAG: S-layer protein [Firmicutes bacterium]|nr:S-layer protein [Bacillota bacterium]